VRVRRGSAGPCAVRQARLGATSEGPKPSPPPALPRKQPGVAFRTGSGGECPARQVRPCTGRRQRMETGGLRQAATPLRHVPQPSFPAGCRRDSRGPSAGRRRMGVYPMLPGGTCGFPAADFDKETWRRVAGGPRGAGTYRSGNGGHVRTFFDAPLPTALARRPRAFICWPGRWRGIRISASVPVTGSSRDRTGCPRAASAT